MSLIDIFGGSKSTKLLATYRAFFIIGDKFGLKCLVSHIEDNL